MEERDQGYKTGWKSVHRGGDWYLDRHSAWQTRLTNDEELTSHLLEFR
jgi:hypothetical protein